MATIKIIDSLTQFLSRKKITIQCHNFPDADTIGAGFALWRYFTDHGIDTRLVYGGSHVISKSNLCMFVDRLFNRYVQSVHVCGQTAHTD